ncbi:MAG: hypothetical protein KDK36_04045 [Leptospiraceae bacterium]|nr:hypothetical protein [Leptospiraceae bacterium]
MKTFYFLFSNFKSFGKYILDLFFIINPDSKTVIARATYTILILDFFYLVLAFLEISGVTSGSGKIFSFVAPKGEDLKTYINFLEYLNLIIFSILGGKTIAQIFAIIAVIRTGGNVVEVVQALEGTGTKEESFKPKLELDSEDLPDEIK